MHTDSHKNLGFILSEDFKLGQTLQNHYCLCLQSIGLLRHTLLSSHTISSLYVSLVQSQLLYCTQIWHAHYFDERHIEHWTSSAMSSVSCQWCHQVYSEWLYKTWLIILDFSLWCTCLNYMIYYLPSNPLSYAHIILILLIILVLVLPILDQVSATNSYLFII